MGVRGEEGEKFGRGELGIERESGEKGEGEGEKDEGSGRAGERGDG